MQSRNRADGSQFAPSDEMSCAGVYSAATGAPLIWNTIPHQASRAEDDSRAPIHRRLPALPWRHGSRESAAISTTKCRGAFAPALQAAPSLLAALDSQIVHRQQVSLAAMGWDILPPDLAAIDIGEVDDRRTISRERDPATHQRARRASRLSRSKRAATIESLP